MTWSIFSSTPTRFYEEKNIIFNLVQNGVTGGKKKNLEHF